MGLEDQKRSALGGGQGNRRIQQLLGGGIDSGIGERGRDLFSLACCETIFLNPQQSSCFHL